MLTCKKTFCTKILIDSSHNATKTYQPEIAPKVFMIPNNDPACLGAKSCGFIPMPLLLQPSKPMIDVIKSKANEKLVT